MSLEEFHRIFDGAKPYHEYWFGEVTAKTKPTSLHGVVQFAMMLLLLARGWKPASEVTLKISPEAELVPDVIATRGKLELPYPTRAIEICLEIMSPDDRLTKIVEKGRRYLDWGVAYVWIVDPVARTAWMVTGASPRVSGFIPTAN